MPLPAATIEELANCIHMQGMSEHATLRQWDATRGFDITRVRQELENWSGRGAKNSDFSYTTLGQQHSHHHFWKVIARGNDEYTIKLHFPTTVGDSSVLQLTMQRQDASYIEGALEGALAQARQVAADHQLTINSLSVHVLADKHMYISINNEYGLLLDKNGHSLLRGEHHLIDWNSFHDRSLRDDKVVSRFLNQLFEKAHRLHVPISSLSFHDILDGSGSPCYVTIHNGELGRPADNYGSKYKEYVARVDSSGSVTIFHLNEWLEPGHHIPFQHWSQFSKARLVAQLLHDGVPSANGYFDRDRAIDPSTVVDIALNRHADGSIESYSIKRGWEGVRNYVHITANQSHHFGK